MMKTKAFAPAKVNLTLHVTGQRLDGYHLLDSLVVFADVGDHLEVSTSDNLSIAVSGPLGEGVPTDERNLALRAADWMGIAAHIDLEKYLPNAAGIGGGSSDAAATLRALKELTGKSWPCYTEHLGADVPVCLQASASRMQGVGEHVTPLPNIPALHAVLVNNGVAVATPPVFKALRCRDNSPMPEVLPDVSKADDLIEWLGGMRNDLQAPAIVVEPGITTVLDQLAGTEGCRLTRLSGSGGTCFGLFHSAEEAQKAADQIRLSQPEWWVVATVLS